MIERSSEITSEIDEFLLLLTQPHIFSNTNIKLKNDIYIGIKSNILKIKILMLKNSEVYLNLKDTFNTHYYILIMTISNIISPKVCNKSFII